MNIEVLVCRPDGTQVIENREVDENYFNTPLTTDERIANLKAELLASDYKVTKCAESSLAGLPAPYDIVSLNAERQALRDQINALEASET